MSTSRIELHLAKIIILKVIYGQLWIELNL